MENAYAQALWKILSGGTEAKKAVASLRDTLVLHGREALLPRIAKAFARLAQAESQKHSVILSVAREKDARRAEHEIKDALKAMGANASAVTVLVDDTLIGGWKLQSGQHLLDRSFKKQLVTIYQRATNTV